MWKCKENAEGRRKIFLAYVRNRTKICLSGFGHYCGGLSFHAYSTIRALHLSKPAALHSAVCHHDGVYLHLRRGGRCFLVQLCGLRCLCCREPHYAVSHGVGCRGLHAGYRWQCAGGVHPGSRQRKACQRDLLPAFLTPMSRLLGADETLPPASPTPCWTLCSWRCCNGASPKKQKGHGRHSLSCPFLCLLTARSRRPWGCQQPETRRCRCAWW